MAQARGDEPAGGAAVGEAVGATLGALVATALDSRVIAAHRSVADQLARAADFAERQTGLPGWGCAASAVMGLSLLTAVLGMYWDISCTSTTAATTARWPTPRTT